MNPLLLRFESVDVYIRTISLIHAFLVFLYVNPAECQNAGGLVCFIGPAFGEIPGFSVGLLFLRRGCRGIILVIFMIIELKAFSILN